MDIFTPKGQKSLSDEREMIKSLDHAYKSNGKNVSFVETPKDKPSKVDGFIVENGIVIGIYESKCRYIDRAKMLEYDDKLIISHHKIESGIRMSCDIFAPFYVLAYLVNEPTCFMIQITDDTGKKVIDVDVRKTYTQASINGGIALRDNAFISIDKAFEFPIVK